MSIFDIMKQAGKELGKPWPAYAWPGGYDMFYIMDDGGTLCAKCMNDESNPIHFEGDLEDNSNDGWKVIGVSATCNTDSEVRCDHCNVILQTEWDGES